MDNSKITYWPVFRGIELNNQVSKLFEKLYFKFNSNLSNKTPSILSIDIANVQIKKEIFKIILLELEILVLDITELEVTMDDLLRLNKKILIDLTNKSIIAAQSLLSYPNSPTISNSLNSTLSYKSLLLEHRLLLQNLILLLVFGSSNIAPEYNSFLKNQVPLKQVEILIDNFVIQLADIVFFNLINSCQSLSQLFDFLKDNNICSENYISARSIATFRNNLLWSQLLSYYIHQPQTVYNNRYQVWLFSINGISCQYVYTSREISFRDLSRLQLVIIIFLEVQDFLLPKIQFFIIFIGKLCTYIFRNTVRFLIKTLLKSFAGVTRSKI
uniref:Ycf55 n=1 Tax=Palmaria palmata TaxID=2822 RepID=A0A1C9CH94_PALPL|nr:hypothetical protein Palma_122 [Palmaria palmata]AOM67754.1 hypothetical protein Palma_122 [Palmaria palmata]